MRMMRMIICQSANAFKNVQLQACNWLARSFVPSFGSVRFVRSFVASFGFYLNLLVAAVLLLLLFCIAIAHSHSPFSTSSSQSRQSRAKGGSLRLCGVCVRACACVRVPASSSVRPLCATAACRLQTRPDSFHFIRFHSVRDARSGEPTRAPPALLLALAGSPTQAQAASARRVQRRFCGSGSSRRHTSAAQKRSSSQQPA